MAKIYSYGICPYVMLNGNVAVLVNKTSKCSNYNFFKGKIEDGETIRECAIREFKEETGISVKSDTLEEYFYGTSKRKNIGIFLVNWNNIDYLKYVSPQPKEIYSWWWLSLSSDEKFSKNQTSIIEDIKKHFRG